MRRERRARDPLRESSSVVIAGRDAHLVCVTITLQAAPTTNASAHRQANDRITRSSNMTRELLAELVPAQPHFRRTS
jgi:hypothetical protein